jgi:peptide deformylase
MNLITYPNDILKRSMPEFDFSSNINPEHLEQDMIELMQKSRGIGLSANQVGIEARVFVMQPQKLDDKRPFALFNPTLLEADDEETLDEEGCLSFPELFLYVKRPKKIKVQYVDKHQNICIIELIDIDARCFLHELDHLNGVCFTEKVSQMKLALAIKKQRKKNGRTK